MPQSFDQTTDPLAPENDYEDDFEWGPMVIQVSAEDSIGDLARDPGKGNVPSGTPLARGSQASDFM
jgi:hypothetical protein